MSLHIEDITESDEFLSKSIQLKKVTTKNVAELYAELVRTKNTLNVLISIIIDSKISDKAEITSLIDGQMELSLNKLEDMAIIDDVFTNHIPGVA